VLCRPRTLRFDGVDFDDFADEIALVGPERGRVRASGSILVGARIRVEHMWARHGFVVLLYSFFGIEFHVLPWSPSDGSVFRLTATWARLGDRFLSRGAFP